MRSSDFENDIRLLIEPINGQLPRPWMSSLADPTSATVFVVGKNQRNGYPDTIEGGLERHIDALFNRNGHSCRNLYGEVTGNKASPTRKNTDAFAQALNDAGVSAILETNVICYSSPMSSDLRLARHLGGSKRGEEIFRYLLQSIAPPVLVVHGASAGRMACKILSVPYPGEPAAPEDIRSVQAESCKVITIPSLAPPVYNKWIGWAPDHLTNVAAFISNHLHH